MVLKRVVIVGAGGIASYLWNPLGRLTSLLGPQRVHVFDGDLFESKNMSRQDMTTKDEGEYKATVLAGKITAAFPSLGVSSTPKFLSSFPRDSDSIQVDEAIVEGDFVLSCVDNHATRLLLSKQIQQLDNGVMISCGNETTTGNVYRFARIGGVNVSRQVERVHPEIADGGHRNPADLSCEERAALPGGEQTLAANCMAASLAVVFASQILALACNFGSEFEEWRRLFKVTEVQFDLETAMAISHQSLAAIPRRNTN